MASLIIIYMVSIMFFYNIEKVVHQNSWIVIFQEIKKKFAHILHNTAKVFRGIPINVLNKIKYRVQNIFCVYNKLIPMTILDENVLSKIQFVK